MTLRLAGSTSGYTEIDAPAVAGSNTLVLPNGNGSNGQPLITNGSGNLSWSNVSSTALGSGCIVKVQSFNDVGSSTNSTSYTNANGSFFNYTPARSSSQLYIMSTFNAQCANVASINNQSYHAIAENNVVQGSGYITRAFTGSGGLGVQSMGVIQVVLSNTSTTARLFHMMHATNSVSGAATTASIYMTIFEVAS